MCVDKYSTWPLGRTLACMQVSTTRPRRKIEQEGKQRRDGWHLSYSAVTRRQPGSDLDERQLMAISLSLGLCHLTIARKNKEK